MSITSPARLRWLARHRPDLFGRIHSLGLLSDWIVYRLAGVQVTEPSCGSSSGMFSLARRTWSARDRGDLRHLPGRAARGGRPGHAWSAQVTAEAAEQTGLRAGTPVVAGGADTQLGLLGAGVRAGEFTVLAGTFWQNTMLVHKPLIDPEIRLRTLCHVTPGEWMLEGIGFYCGMAMRWFRDAFCDGEVAAARGRGVDPYVVMEEEAARIPPGSNGVVAILSNLMNARRWVHASPSFLGFDLGDPAGTGRAACIRAIEEAAAYVVRGHLGIIAELTGARVDRADVLRRRGQGQAVAAGHRRRARPAGARPGGDREQRAGRGAVRGPGRRAVLQPDRAGGRRCASARPRSSRGPAAVATYDDRYARWRQIYPRMLELSEDGLVNPLWRAAGADAALTGPQPTGETWWQTTTAGRGRAVLPGGARRAPQPYRLKGSAAWTGACRAGWPGCSARPPAAR